MDFKKKLKIEAIMAAKEKAGFLTNAIGEKLGRAIEIEELPNQEIIYTNANTVFERSNSVGYYSDNSKVKAGGYETSFKKIKLNYFKVGNN